MVASVACTARRCLGTARAMIGHRKRAAEPSTTEAEATAAAAEARAARCTCGTRLLYPTLLRPPLSAGAAPMTRVSRTAKEALGMRGGHSKAMAHLDAATKASFATHETRAVIPDSTSVFERRCSGAQSCVGRAGPATAYEAREQDEPRVACCAASPCSRGGLARLYRDEGGKADDGSKRPQRRDFFQLPEEEAAAATAGSACFSSGLADAKARGGRLLQ